jgi:hypothetical protein
MSGHGIRLKDSGADVLLYFSTPKFTAQGLRDFSGAQPKAEYLPSQQAEMNLCMQ